MGIGDDDDLPRTGDAVVRHQLMTDAFVDIHQVRDALLVGEGPELFVVVCLFFRGAGSVMVKEENDLFRVKDFFPAHFVKGFYSLVIQVVDAGYVHIAIYDFSRVDGSFAGFFCQEFFNGMHGGFLLL